MLDGLVRLHRNIQARILRFFRAREVVQVVKTLHARELAETPVAMWAVKKAEQAREIAAVRQGKFDIIDRRSWAYPYIPEALHRLNQPILKNTPYNLRRFTETPIPRRALNLVKNAILALKWRVIVDEDYDQDDPDLLKNAKIAKYCLQNPNLTDSWRTLMEAVVEDFLVGGYGTIEPQLTPDYRRPVKLWAMDGSTVRIYADWSESTPERPHYAQLTGLKGERGIISFLDDELVYIRDNVRSSTPFGLGRCETAFLTINAFLGAQDMATRAGADQIHKTWVWFTANLPPGQFETVQRHIQNEAEGQQKISIMTGMPKPETVDVQAVTPEDLLLDWQEFLIRIIAAAFELSPMALGIERDVNRSTAAIMNEKDFDSAVVPCARKLEEAVTRQILHRTLGWKELKFEFIGLEDPDEMVQTMLARQLYSTNAMTPDEIRDRLQIGPPLPGGWGKLTMGQQQLMMAAIVGKAGGMSGGGGMGMGGGMGSSSSFGGSNSSGGMGSSTGMGMGSFGVPGMRGQAGDDPAAPVQSLDDSPFDAQDIANMDPNTLEMYRQAGIIPQDPTQLQTDMESQQPGILQTLSEELLEYFDWLEQEQEREETQPSEVTDEDMQQQADKFKKRQHELSREEAMARGINQENYMYQSSGYRGPVPKNTSLARTNNPKPDSKQKIKPPSSSRKKFDRNYTGRTLR